MTANEPEARELKNGRPPAEFVIVLVVYGAGDFHRRDLRFIFILPFPDKK